MPLCSLAPGLLAPTSDCRLVHSALLVLTSLATFSRPVTTTTSSIQQTYVSDIYSLLLSKLSLTRPLNIDPTIHQALHSISISTQPHNHKITIFI
ncbi:hypothetical protein QBC43DRAFT_321817 [Cladorrhinum sp. PSN259]|nr:hypothetical protein QBC43DRAFT_321817 [Cladorrhinum sp. PSN259]